MNSNYAPIPIIERMSAVLDIVLNTPTGVRAADLLRMESNIPKTTLYRLLTAMVKEDFLLYNPDSGIYSIGPKFTLTHISIDEQNHLLKDAATSHLQWLAEQIQETVKLSILSGWHAYVIASVESPQPVHIKIDADASFPLHAGATGKVLMCDFNKSMLEKYYQLYGKRHTSTTIMSTEEMESELALIKSRGYALDNGEYLPEILAIAVPVRDQIGNTIAALSTPYPSIHRERVEIPRTVELLNQTAAAISASYNQWEIKENPARLVDCPQC